MRDDSDAQRLDELEIKVTLLERANEEMSQVIIEQQASINRLQLQLEHAGNQLQRLGEQISTDNAPPPHY